MDSNPFLKYVEPESEGENPFSKYATGEQDADFSDVKSGSSTVDKKARQKSDRALAMFSVPEAALSMATGAVGSTVGGLGGLAALPFMGGDAGSVTRAIQGAMTYEPRTEGGKGVLETISWPFAKYSEAVGTYGDYLRGVGGDEAKGKAGRYTAYGWGDRKESPEDLQTRDKYATAIETALEAAPTLAGLLKYKPAPGAPTFDPRRAIADRRISDAFSSVPANELKAGSASQANAGRLGYQLTPSQALSYEYPALSALEAELRGSRAPNARAFQDVLSKQPQQAATLSGFVGSETAPYNTAPVAAKQVADAARLSVGEIERTPNVLTKGLYDIADKSPGLIPANRVNALIAELRKIRNSNPGREAITSQVDDLITRINDQRLVVQGQVMRDSGRPVPLDSVPLPGNVATNISKEISGTFNSLMMQRPDLKGGVEAQVGKMAGMLDEEARLVSPELKLATDVQRAMRPQFTVDRFNPLDQASRGTGAPLTFIDRVFGNDKVDPAAFKSFAEQINRTDPNAIRDALGHYVSQAKDRAFATLADGNLNPSAGVDFANRLIGTPNKREAFRTALIKAGEGRQGVVNPAAYADEIIKMVELTRDLSKQVGTNVGRATKTEISGTDPIKVLAGQQLQSRSAITNILISVWNKLSDNLVAESFLDVNSIDRILRQSLKQGRPKSNAAPLSLVGLQGSLQSAEGINE